LVPELTRHIPTPLDISTDPEVVGANLGLAAVAVALLAIIQEVVNRILSEHEPAIQGVLRRLKLFAWLPGRAERAERPKPHGRLRNAIALVFIVLLYGLIFSLLERSWNPFTLAGLWLFVSMSFACGLVGLLDDLAEWRTARRWGLPTSLSVRPGNLVLALTSTAVSRVLTLVPGIMFGVPEAFEADTASLDKQRQRGLLLAGLRMLLIVGMSAWLLSGVTNAVTTVPPIVSLGVDLAPDLASWIGGVQAFLLLTFASAVQSIFLGILGLPGTVGRALREWNLGLWGFGMLSSTFLYFHTLVNPQGDLAAALGTTSMRLCLITAAGFGVLAVATWLYFRALHGKTTGFAGTGEEE
jgi:hypothetical protein